RRLGMAGFAVTAHYRSNDASAESLAEEIRASGGHADTLGFDITDREATRAALEADIETRGMWWGVVLNAGITADHAVPATPGEDWDRVVDTNLGGFYNVLHPLTMPLVRLRDGGRIVSIASVAGQTGNRGQVNYSAAKAGLIGASKALAVELAKRRITVNCVA